MSCWRKVRSRATASHQSKHILIHLLGYKEYKTERTYMARMGDWRDNKDVEIPLDGIGGVNILVKADVHRSGTFHPCPLMLQGSLTRHRHQLSMLRLRKPSRDRRLREDGETSGLWCVRSTQLRRLAHRHGREAWECVGLAISDEVSCVSVCSIFEALFTRTDVA
jgi:hypothetical protein